MRTLPAVSLASLVLSLSAGCGHRAPASSEAPTNAAPALRVVNPVQQLLLRTIEQPAQIEAFERTPIHAKVSGYVRSVNVEIGSRVHKGDVLAEAAVPELEEDLKLKKGMVAQAKLDIAQVEQARLVAEANCKAAESLVREAGARRKHADAHFAYWKMQSERMESLVKSRVIDPQTRDETVLQFHEAAAGVEEAVTRVTTAEANHAESRARLSKCDADIASARNRLTLAEIEERRAAVMLDYTNLVAPFSGVVAERHVDTGHLLRPPGGKEEKSEPLFVVVRTDKVRVFLEVPEADESLIVCGEKNGSIVHIRVPSLNDREFTGRVVGTSWLLEKGQRTLRTEVDLDNADGALRPGMYAQAQIEASQTDAWTLPTKALLYRDGQVYCFLHDGGKAVRTEVRVGRRDGSVTQVLKLRCRPDRPGNRSGWRDFTNDDAILVGEIAELGDGQTVEPRGE